MYKNQLHQIYYYVLHRNNGFYLQVYDNYHLVRIPLFKFVSGDMSGYLIVWYDTIKAYGGIHALNIQVGNYSVLYQTLIALMTYIPLSPVVLYKSLSVVFDYVLAVAVARFVYEETGKNINKAVFSFAMVLLSPIVIMNSAMWGQCDSIFTSFLVLTVLKLYYLFF